ncbi:MAG: CPBP family intramembrane metalloprotease [Bryobacterales bacterium]|nr:CPBP family intramembrane metalloprotease [Bryobacterales bacterium]
MAVQRPGPRLAAAGGGWLVVKRLCRRREWVGAGCDPSQRPPGTAPKRRPERIRGGPPGRPPRPGQQASTEPVLRRERVRDAAVAVRRFSIAAAIPRVACARREDAERFAVQGVPHPGAIAAPDPDGGRGFDELAQLRGAGHEPVEPGYIRSDQRGIGIAPDTRLGPSRFLGEEIGWRGFLVPELAKRLSFTATSIVSGLIWASWHVLIIVFAGYNAGTGWFGLSVVSANMIGLCFVLTWLRLKSGNLWTCVILQASNNRFIQHFFDQMTAHNDRTRHILGEFGIGFTLVVAVSACISRLFLESPRGSIRIAVAAAQFNFSTSAKYRDRKHFENAAPERLYSPTAVRYRGQVMRFLPANSRLTAM